MAKYVEITEEIKNQLLNLADGEFAVKDRVQNGQPVRNYIGVQTQFKQFPAKYILEGIEQELEPEDISNNIYYWFKYGKTPEEVMGNPTTDHLYRGVPMVSYHEGPDETSETENMLRYVCGKVQIELTKLLAPTP